MSGDERAKADAWAKELSMFQGLLVARFPGFQPRDVKQAATGILLLTSLSEDELLLEAARFIGDELQRRGLEFGAVPQPTKVTGPTAVPDSEPGGGDA